MLKNSFNPMQNKKAVSDVVATVLLILVTIAAIALIAAVIIPFVQDNLQNQNEELDCFDVSSEVSFVTKDSCLSDTDVNLKVRFGNVETNTIYVLLEDSQGNVERFDLVEGENLDRFTPNPIDLPSKGGGEKTYSISRDGKEYKESSVGVIINKKACNVGDTLVLRRC